MTVSIEWCTTWTIFFHVILTYIVIVSPRVCCTNHTALSVVLFATFHLSRLLFEVDNSSVISTRRSFVENVRVFGPETREPFHLGPLSNPPRGVRGERKRIAPAVKGLEAFFFSTAFRSDGFLENRYFTRRARRLFVQTADSKPRRRLYESTRKRTPEGGGCRRQKRHSKTRTNTVFREFLKRTNRNWINRRTIFDPYVTWTRGIPRGFVL